MLKIQGRFSIIKKHDEGNRDETKINSFDVFRLKRYFSNVKNVRTLFNNQEA